MKEVWLGDCYPASFDNLVPPENRDVFCHIAEITKNDLQVLEKKLIDLGVTVRRPDFSDPGRFLDHQEKLIKPPICPRDWAFTLDQTLYISPQYPNSYHGFEPTVKLYTENLLDVRVLDRKSDDPWLWITFPSTVRVGRDLLIDYGEEKDIALIEAVLKNLANHYRVHVSRTGDHSDGVFCPVKPGWIFSTHYKEQYESTFPGWNVFFLPDTTKSRNNSWNMRWWCPGLPFPTFNKAVFDIADRWIGNSAETVFEVNMLIVDEKNVICIAEDDASCRKLEELGITPHVVDFKTRGFWDGGIHCLTLDINRVGEKIDYWPDRGPNGLFYHGA